MTELSQMVKNKVQKLQNRQEQKRSTDSNNKLNDERLKEAMKANRELREQELKEKIKYFLKISNLPANWWEKTFEKSEVLSEEENEIKYRLEYYCRYFKEAKSKGLGLYLCGEVGTGKSFYSLCVFNELLKNDYIYLSKKELEKYKFLGKGFFLTGIVLLLMFLIIYL